MILFRPQLRIYMQPHLLTKKILVTALSVCFMEIWLETVMEGLKSLDLIVISS